MLVESALSIRDFAYPPSNPMHFGHYTMVTTNSLPMENYQAKALYRYERAIDGEISLEEEEVIQVLKNLGNGWVCAKKDGDPEIVGLIPENYLKRV